MSVFDWLAKRSKKGIAWEHEEPLPDDGIRVVQLQEINSGKIRWGVSLNGTITGHRYETRYDAERQANSYRRQQAEEWVEVPF